MMETVKASCWQFMDKFIRKKKVGDQWVVEDGLAIWWCMVVLDGTGWVSTKEKSTPWQLQCGRGCFILDKKNKKSSKLGCCNWVSLLER